MCAVSRARNGDMSQNCNVTMLPMTKLTKVLSKVDKAKQGRGCLTLLQGFGGLVVCVAGTDRVEPALDPRGQTGGAGDLHGP